MLAMLGGTPVRNNKLYYGCQTIDENDSNIVAKAVLDDLITCGPKIEKFENELCKYTGAKHAIVLCNGTAALHIACLAAGVGPGDEVITTPLTFAASANCALYCGAKPVFADINPETYNIDPKKIIEKITNKTKAIVAVDFTGQVCETEEIRKICNEHNLIFIEDAAHSIGSKYKGKMVGSFADITTFSFHPVKTITGGEGGAMLTNNDEIAKKLYLLRTHGITHDIDMYEHEDEGPWYHEQIMLGYNYRLTDFQAALLSSQLSKIDKFIKRRKEIVKMYDKAFSEIPEIFVQKEIPESDTCRHLYILRLKLDKLSCTRREFFDSMSAEGIQCQVHYKPVYWHPYYEHLGYKKGLCPNAEKYYEEVMSLPLYPKLSDSDVNDVIEAVKKVITAYKK